MKFSQVYKIDDDYIVMRPDERIPPAGVVWYADTPQEALELHHDYGAGVPDPVRPNHHATRSMIREAALRVAGEPNDDEVAPPQVKIVCENTGLDCPGLIGLFRRKFPHVVEALSVRVTERIRYNGLEFTLERTR